MAVGEQEKIKDNKPNFNKSIFSHKIKHAIQIDK